MLLSVFDSLEGYQAKQVSCESVIEDTWEQIGTVKTCYMRQTTLIDSPGVAITHHETIDGIYFGGNKKIFFLPEYFVEMFLNLKIYAAHFCSIREVSKLNFRRLARLKVLFLHRNQIEKITSDTFEDLASLKELYLCEMALVAASLILA